MRKFLPYDIVVDGSSFNVLIDKIQNELIHKEKAEYEYVDRGILAGVYEAFPISSDNDKYEDAVIYHLRKLKSSKIGKIILDALTEQVTIVPYIKIGQNATGAINKVEFTPAKFMPSKSSSYTRIGNLDEFKKGITPASILLHELVHSLIFQKRLRKMNWSDNHYDNNFDHVAIMVANIYRSEQSYLELRVNHQNFNTQVMLEDEFIDDKREQRSMRLFRRSMPHVFDKIANTWTWWNPVRRWSELYTQRKTK